MGQLNLHTIRHMVDRKKTPSILIEQSRVAILDAPMNARLRESYRLALRTGEQNLIAEAKASLAMVAGFGK